MGYRIDVVLAGKIISGLKIFTNHVVSRCTATLALLFNLESTGRVDLA